MDPHRPLNLCAVRGDEPACREGDDSRHHCGGQHSFGEAHVCKQCGQAFRLNSA